MSISMRKLILTLCSVLLIVTGICAIVASIQFKNNSVKIVAQIDDVKEETKRDDNYNENIVYKLRLKYNVENKTYYYYTTEEDRYVFRGKYKKGDQFELYYDKTNPSIANTSNSGHELFGIIEIVMGVFFGLISVKM